MSRMTLAALTTIVLPALACSSMMQPRNSDARVALTTDRSIYAPADTVSVTLQNDSNADVGYNLCNRALELRTSISWKEVQRFPELPNVCIMSLSILSPGASGHVAAVMPSSASAGRYRLTFFGSPPEARATNEFEIASH